MHAGRLTRRLGVLATHPQTPVVPQTTVGADLLEPLEVVTELRVDTVGQDLRVFAVDNVLLSVQEPSRNLELGGVLDDRDDPLELVRVEVTGTAQLSATRTRCIPLRRTAC